MGAGAGKHVSAVRWGVAGNIVVAWLLRPCRRRRPMGAAALRFLPDLRERSGRTGHPRPRSASTSLAPACSARQTQGRSPCRRAGRAAEMLGDHRRDQEPAGHGDRVARWPESGSRRSSQSLVFGVTRSADMTRDERPLLATAAGGLAAIAFLVVTASIVVGIVVMTRK